MEQLAVDAGADQLGEGRRLGISSNTFKIVLQNGNGLFIIKHTFQAKGGLAALAIALNGLGLTGRTLYLKTSTTKNLPGNLT